MKTSYCCSILLLAASGTGCDTPMAPDTDQAAILAMAPAHAAPHSAAAGTFTQTGITSLDVRQAGPNTILTQTSVGSVSGTLSGTYTDDLRVVIHPGGRFNAQFTIRCACTVAGEQGTLDIVASDTGEIISPTLAAFAGRAVITSGSAALADLRGVLRIEGTVDIVSGLSNYAYTGSIH
ncbi:MAG TPA: hypothetical protein VFZ69_04895 [Longimicrobiales bacterium]